MTWLETKLEGFDDPAAPTVPTRALDTEFTPSATKHVFVQFTINIVNTAGQETSVELRSDAASPPTVVRGSAKLVSGATDGQTMQQQLTYIVPPGHIVKLVSAGTGTPTISSQSQMVLT